MAALATTANLESRLGRSLTAAEALKAPSMLADASAKIRRYCRREFSAVANGEIVLRPVGMELRLPNKPVTGVDSVEMVGTGGTADLTLSVNEWAWDGIDKITLFPCTTEVTGAVPTGTYANTYRVTYDSGGTVDDFIVGKTCEIVLRALLSPTQVAGLVQERIGQYSYQFGQFPGGQSIGISVKLTADDKRELREAGYRSSASTIQLVAT